ncbi:hypothetical protein B0H19DRAFT_1079195 [Mycena capillaripes]|nr:hypothetical protein B0H19DRAFT_1079195 [Mycena capillaripes]
MSAGTLCPLAELPTELLLEIVSHHQYDSFDFLCPLLQDSVQQQDRRDALRSLSQTCSVLRQVSLPLMWERFEVIRPNFHRSFSEWEVAPLIFPYIKSVHISLLNWSPEHQMRIIHFVQFLHTLPNLISLRIYQVPLKIAPLLTSAFARECSGMATFLRVTALSVPASIGSLFPRFPNVKTLACQQIFPSSRTLLLAKAYFPHLEALVGLRIQDIAIMTKEQFIPGMRGIDHPRAVLIRNFPHLRSISIGNPLPPDFESLLASLSGFTHLRFFSLFHRAYADFIPLDGLIAGGRAALKWSQNHRREGEGETKELRVWSNEGSAGPRVVHKERW